MARRPARAGVADVTDADAREFIGTLRRHFADRLTEWEEEFLTSIEQRLDDGGGLSPRMKEVLDQLMERRARGYGR